MPRRVYDIRMRLFVSLLFLVTLSAQPPQDGAKQGKRAPSPPKNLKLLKPEEVRPMMGAFRAALGVECTFCHVQGAFDSDDNPKKEIARHMIAMTKEINAKFPDGKDHVACYTCHRGAATPLMAAPAAGPAGQ